MKLTGIVESALYVDHVARSSAFYQSVFGCQVLTADASGRFAALSVADANVLLLFSKGANLEPQMTPGGLIPAHHGTGNLHFAFGIASKDYDAWKARLLELGIAIESEVTWPMGGRSLYFRDPEGNLGELITPGVWANH